MAATTDAFAIDFSYANTLAECPRKFKYRYEDGFVSLERSMPLHAGRAGHAAMYELWRSGWDLEAALAALRAAWGDVKPAPTGDFSYLTLGHMEIVLRNFAEQFPKLGYEPIMIDEKMLAEEIIVYEWDGLTIGGKPDFPVRKDGALYVLDWKFTNAWVTEWWFSKFRLSHQLRTYIKLLEVRTGLRFDGAYICGIYMGEKASDPPDAWKKRKSQPFAIGGPFLFQRSHLQETREWYGALLRTRDLYRSLNVWPQTPSEKCGQCEFLQLCQAHPMARATLASTNFARRTPSGILASGADESEIMEG